MTINHSDITLEIDLHAIAHNYLTMAGKCPEAKCGAVVKANAYGLGVEKISLSLYEAGCRDFFVATLNEGIELSQILIPDTNIYILHGIRKGEEKDFEKFGLIPVLNDENQLSIWKNHSEIAKNKLACVISFDTGMNRLGIDYSRAEEIAKLDLSALNIKYIMSHLACADDKDHPLNKIQLKRTNEIKKHFPNQKFSLSNSWGIVDGEEYQFDLCRPGRSLYGINIRTANLGVKNVVTVKAKITQIRDISEDGIVGYRASKQVKKGDRLAIIPVGYADGYLRTLSNNSHAFFGEYKLPQIGVVSMDNTIFDISHVPENEISINDEVEIIGKNYHIDDVAENAGTIGYEVLTRLGMRYNRVYK